MEPDEIALSRRFAGNEKLIWIRRASHLLDEAFRIPGTKFRFGWDPIISLIPGLGDLVVGFVSLMLLTEAYRLQLPGVVTARMVLNVLIDVLIGAIPFAGDAFDFAWKSNKRNLKLLEKHAGTGKEPGLGDWLFVLGIVTVAFLVLALPVLALVFLFRALQN